MTNQEFEQFLNRSQMVNKSSAYFDGADIITYPNNTENVTENEDQSDNETLNETNRRIILNNKMPNQLRKRMLSKDKDLRKPVETRVLLDGDQSQNLTSLREHLSNTKENGSNTSIRLNFKEPI